MVSTKTNRGRISLIAGLVIAALGITGTVLLRNSSPFSSSTNGPSGAQVAVVAAKVDIPAGTKISIDQITFESMPTAAVPLDAAQSSGAVVGKYAAVTIRARQIVLPDVLVSNPVAASGNGTSSTFALKDGDVALTLPDDKTSVMASIFSPATTSTYWSIPPIPGPSSTHFRTCWCCEQGLRRRAVWALHRIRPRPRAHPHS